MRPRVATTFSIWQVGDCGFQIYQIVMKLKRATTPEFTTYAPICYIHCCGVVIFYALMIFVLHISSILYLHTSQVSSIIQSSFLMNP